MDENEIYKEFALKGEEAVRGDLELGRLGRAKASLARLWLEGLNKERRNESEGEQLELARRATAAAEASATSARLANRHAGRANWIAGFALVVAVIAVVVSIFDH